MAREGLDQAMLYTQLNYYVPASPDGSRPPKAVQWNTVRILWPIVMLLSLTVALGCPRHATFEVFRQQEDLRKTGCLCRSALLGIGLSR